MVSTFFVHCAPERSSSSSRHCPSRLSPSAARRRERSQRIRSSFRASPSRTSRRGYVLAEPRPSISVLTETVAKPDPASVGKTDEPNTVVTPHGSSSSVLKAVRIDGPVERRPARRSRSPYSPPPGLPRRRWAVRAPADSVVSSLFSPAHPAPPGPTGRAGRALRRAGGRGAGRGAARVRVRRSSPRARRPAGFVPGQPRFHRVTSWLFVARPLTSRLGQSCCSSDCSVNLGDGREAAS